MAASEQQPDFMSSIKCSSCGQNLNLAAVAEHICLGSAAVPVMQISDLTQPLPPPSLNIEQPRKNSISRPPRPLLPRIDPHAGNRPPMFLGELTPASSGHGSLEISPRSASSGYKSPWRTAPRKSSAPSVQRPPSPELTNLDCAFPPFPTSSTRNKTPVNENTSQNLDMENEYTRLRAGTFHQSAVSNPRSSTVGGSSVRSNRAMSVSSSRHRKEGGMKPPTSSQVRSPSNSRRPSFSSAPATRKGSVEEAPPLPTATPAPTSQKYQNSQDLPQAVDTEPSRHTASRSRDHAAPVVGLGLQTVQSAPEPMSDMEQVSEGIPGPESTVSPPEPQPSREPSYKLKRPPPIESGKSLPLLRRFKTILTPKRAPTFPLLGGRSNQESEQPEGLKQASESTTGPSGISEQSPTVPATEPIDHFGLPIHHQSRTGAEPWEQSAIPLTESPAAEDHMSPEDSHEQYLTKSEENLPASSLEFNFGITSDPSVAVGSSQTQEPQSPARIMQDSDIRDLEDLMSPAPNSSGPRRTRSTMHTSTDSASSYGSINLSLRSASSRSSVHMRDELQPPQDSSDPAAEHPDTDQVQIPPFDTPHFPSLPPDSPTDPLFQQGRLSPIPPSNGRRTPSESSKINRSSILLELPQVVAPRGSKGTCRGCSTTISATQKSVSSADGRLTGRYHKSCFVCKTCKSPFATADFYVFDDLPYCGQHYHELNGTICGSCSKGIEGQYMETSTVGGKPSKKFHANCLTCATCKMLLREDYFELNGRVYCEKDAFRLASLPNRSHYDSAPTRPSPLVRELVTSSGGAGNDRGTGSLMGLVGKFPERRLTRLTETIETTS